MIYQMVINTVFSRSWVIGYGHGDGDGYGLGNGNRPTNGFGRGYSRGSGYSGKSPYADRHCYLMRIDP